MTKGHLYLVLAVVLGIVVYEKFVAGKFEDRDLVMGVTLGKVVMALTVAVAVIMVHKALPVSA
jgi:high-affinity Fe2+/Pb2+ permease